MIWNVCVTAGMTQTNTQLEWVEAVRADHTVHQQSQGNICEKYEAITQCCYLGNTLIWQLRHPQFTLCICMRSNFYKKMLNDLELQWSLPVESLHGTKPLLQHEGKSLNRPTACSHV